MEMSGPVFCSYAQKVSEIPSVWNVNGMAILLFPSEEFQIFRNVLKDTPSLLTEMCLPFAIFTSSKPHSKVSFNRGCANGTRRS